MDKELNKAITFIKAGNTQQGGTLLKQIVKDDPKTKQPGCG